MKTFQRILAVVLCLVMSLSVLGTVAFAAESATIDTTKKGSITVHKYEKGDGATADGTGEETTVTGHEPLADVTFELYQVMTQAQMLAYYNGTDDTTVTVDNFVSQNTDGSYTVKNKDGQPVTATTENTKTTDSTGVVSFTNLALGMYVIIETSAPAKVTVAEKPFLVSVPMTKASNDSEWLYDINVYPKNRTSEGNVTVTKTDVNGSAISGVEFTLTKPDGTTDVQVTTTNGTVTWPSLTQGDYTLQETKAPDGYIVDDRTISFTVTQNNSIESSDSRATWDENTKTLKVSIVNEKPTFTKEITANKDVAGVGETVTYKLTTTVPTNIAEMETYTITDAPKGLSVVESTIAVKDGNDTVTAYTKTMNTDGGFTLTFTPSAMGDYAGKELVITYDATVTTAAVAATGKNANEAPNTATLTYSDSLTTNSTSEIDDDEVTKLYKATITKKLDSESGSVAPGVKFMAYDNASCTTALTFTQETDGSYTLDPNGTVTELVTDSNGKIVINGLGKHYYYLVETETVTNYNLLSGSVTMKVGDETDYHYETTIINKKGFELPTTGGIGTLMFFIIGGVLIAGGICLITVPNKKRSV